MKLYKKKEILTVTEKLINRFGIKKTAVNDIAELANVAKGTIYNYFGSKDGLIKELLTGKLKAFEDILNNSISNVKDPLVKIKITLTERVKILIDNPFLCDRKLNQNDRNVKHIIDELDKNAKRRIKTMIDFSFTKKIPNVEKNRIINTLLFTIKGIEEYIRSRFESVSIDQFEKEIDYLISLMFSKYTYSV